MQKFARLTDPDDAGNRVVIETHEAENSEALAERFHPDLAEQFTRVAAAAVPGSVKNGGKWTHPEAPDEPEDQSDEA